MPQIPSNRSRTPVRPLTLGAAVIAAFAFLACQDGAGPPPTLDPGLVTFSYTGALGGTFTADGRCYWSDGYPAADSACALALDLGDTIRIRAVRDPRTIRWIHVNLEFPEDGSCDVPGACRIAFDRITVGGKIDRSYRSSEATVTILENTADRLRGTFSGRAYDVDGEPRDTIRIVDGAFDVPVER